MKLYMSDLYRVEIHYPLDEVQQDILYYLYQPIIGTEEISTYMMLYMEGKRMNRYLKPSTFSRLNSFLSFPLNKLEKSILSLEAIGLIKTYVKNENNLTQYIFTVLSPLSLPMFFKNQILLQLLKESISKEDFQRTLQYFKINVEKKNGFDEVTSTFQDVFKIQQIGKRLTLKRNDVKNYTSQNVEIKYDETLLFQALQDYQVSRRVLSQEDITYMTQLAFVYAIDALTLAGMVKESIEDNHFNQKKLKHLVHDYYEMNSVSSLNEVYHKQPLQFSTQSNENDPLILHMKYLDTITPYDLLKEKQGGKEPVFHDLMIIETLMVQLGLKPAVVNVLIEYALGKNNHRLSKRYCETVGSSWARKHINTAMDAYRELMGESQEKEVVEMKDTKNTKSQMKSDEIEQLLSELKGGIS